MFSFTITEVEKDLMSEIIIFWESPFVALGECLEMIERGKARFNMPQANSRE